MHLLYLDDSGSAKNPSDKYVILAGISVYERQTHWLGQELDKLAAKAWPEKPQSLEFRGSDIFSGKKHWRGIDKYKRLEIYREALEIIRRNTRSVLFGAAINKVAVSPRDPTEYAFEQLASRFDQMLLRFFRQKNPQRGIIVFDKSSYETSLQALAHEFKNNGHTWGRLTNMTEVPLFVDSKVTRLIQYADLIAYAMRRYYEHHEAAYFDIISPRFDADGGVIHGLVHYTQQQSGCRCPSCLQRTGY